MATITCERCGFDWTVNTIRKNPRLCQSCRATKVQTVHTRQGKCIPWHGNFAPDQVTPVNDEGHLVMPGLRSCGKKDCVAPSHWISDVGGLL